MRKICILFFLGVFTAAGLYSQTYSTVSTFAGNGTQVLLDGPSALAEFNTPRGVAVDPATGTVYVTDTYAHVVRKIKNGVVSTLAGNGTSGDVDAQGANARFIYPNGIKFFNGYIYMTDAGANKIKRIDTSGNVITFAGTGAVGNTDGPALSATFNNSTDLAIDNNGAIYVADYLNHTVRKIANNSVSTIAGIPGTPGDQVGPAGSALFDHPVSVATNPQGTIIYIADMINNKIKVLQSGT